MPHEADPASPLLLVSRARRDRAARRRRCRLLACGSSGEAREALDVLSAADGEGEAARSPSALYRWRTLVLRACGAGPFGAEARALLELPRHFLDTS